MERSAALLVVVVVVVFVFVFVVVVVWREVCGERRHRRRHALPSHCPGQDLIGSPQLSLSGSAQGRRESNSLRPVNRVRLRRN